MFGQLTIFDELDRDRRGLRRIGDGPELGRALLEMLLAAGWRLHRVRAFAGEHEWLFILTNRVFEVKRTATADKFDDVVLELAQEAASFMGAAAA